MIELHNETYYSTEEISKKLTVTNSRISQLRKAGLLGFYEPSPKKYFYSETHLQNYITGKKPLKIPGPTSQKELLDQLAQITEGSEDSFDKLIKNHEEQSYSSWKADFLEGLSKTEESLFSEQILRIVYVKYFKHSAWLKDLRNE
jgi:hypothetical protein